MNRTTIFVLVGTILAFLIYKSLLGDAGVNILLALTAPVVYMFSRADFHKALRKQVPEQPKRKYGFYIISMLAVFSAGHLIVQLLLLAGLPYSVVEITHFIVLIPLVYLMGWWYAPRYVNKYLVR